MDSHFAPESAASISDLRSPSLATEQSPESSITSKPRSASASAIRRPKSSAMLWDSMHDASTDSWIASLQDGRVSLTALPESGAESLTSGGFGKTSLESSERPELRSSLAKTLADCSATPIAQLAEGNWKTSQQTLWGGWEPFSGIWPRWGLCQCGEVYELPTWEPRTVDREFSFWPTSRAEDSESTGAHRGAADTLTSATAAWQTPAVDSFRSRGGERKDEMGLDQQARFWNTPRTITGAGESGERKKQLGLMESGGGDLQAQTENWPTPTGATGGRVKQFAQGGMPLDGFTRNWPSPAASRDHRDPNLLSYQERSGSKKGEQLPNFVEHHWKTPHGLQYRPEAGDPGGGGEFAKEAEHWGPSLPDRPIPFGLTFYQRVRILRRLCHQLQQRLPSPYGKGRSIFRPKLNPIFVDWLMGWPDGWSSVDRVYSAEEMESYLCRQRQYLLFLLGELG